MTLIARAWMSMGERLRLWFGGGGIAKTEPGAVEAPRGLGIMPQGRSTFMGLTVVERPWVPAGTAILVSPGIALVPEGLTLEEELELWLMDITSRDGIVAVRAMDKHG